MTSPQLTPELLRLLCRVALTRQGEFDDLIEELTDFAQALAATDESAAGDVLTRAFDLLRDAGDAPEVSDLQIGRAALWIGPCARRLGWPAVERAAYELAVARMDPARNPHTLGVVRHALARVFTRDDEPARALESLRMAAKLKNFDRNITLVALAEAEAARGNPDAADRALQTALEELASRAQLATADPDTVGEAQALGRAAERLGRPALARAAYEVGVGQLRDGGDAETLGIFWHDIADTLRTENQSTQAFEAYSRAMELKRDDRMVTLVALAQAAAASGNTEASDLALRTGLEELAARARHTPVADDHVVRDAQKLGRAASGLGRPALARSAFEVAIERLDAAEDPQQLGIFWHDVADTWRAEKELERALACYGTAVELKREDRMVTLVAFAETQAVHGDGEASDQTLQAAIAELAAVAQPPPPTAPRVPYEAWTVGRAAERLDRPAIARAAYELAVTWLDPDRDAGELAVIWHDIGDTWNSENQPERAAESHRIAAELDSSDAGGRSLQAALAELTARARFAPLTDAGVVRDARELGYRCENAEQPALARAAYELAAERLDPERDAQTLGAIWHDIADTWRAQDELAQALHAYRRASDLKREDRIDSLIALTEVAAAAGDREATDEAATATVDELAANTASAPAGDSGAGERAWKVGRALARLGRPAAARRAFELATQRLDADADAHLLGVVSHDIGDTWLREKQPRRAAESYRVAVSLKRHDRLVSLTALATAEQASGDAAAADRTLQTALAELTTRAQRASPTDAGIVEDATHLGAAADRLARPAIREAAQRMVAATRDVDDQLMVPAEGSP